MKKRIKFYLFPLLSILALMTVAQAKKTENAPVQVCSAMSIPNTAAADGTEPYTPPGMCQKTCDTKGATTQDGGKWDGNGDFNGIWTNPANGIDMGKCKDTSICQCVPKAPPPPSCCDNCETVFNTCKSEGKLPILTCSKNWETCASACLKLNPGKQCTPPSGDVPFTKGKVKK